MLETRIRCIFLPENLNDLQNFIASITYLPLNNDQKSIEIKNQSYKIIHEAKDRWLNHLLNAYEIKIKDYEHRRRKLNFLGEAISLKMRLYFCPLLPTPLLPSVAKFTAWQ
jgi:hypothetical protein